MREVTYGSSSPGMKVVGPWYTTDGTPVGNVSKNALVGEKGAVRTTELMYCPHVSVSKPTMNKGRVIQTLHCSTQSPRSNIFMIG